MKSKILIALLALNFIHTVFYKANASEVLKFEAQYKIPSMVNEDQNFATYQLTDYQVEVFAAEENKPSTLTYTLPKEMVGTATTIELQLIASRDGEKYLAGEHAAAKCQGPWSQMKCEMRFHDLNVDLIAVEKVLQERGASESEINTRLQILSRFSGDPIGFTETKTP